MKNLSLIALATDVVPGDEELRVQAFSGSSFNDFIQTQLFLLEPRTVSPSAVSSPLTVASPSVVPGPVTLSPSALFDELVVAAPTVVIGGVVMTPEALADALNVIAPSLLIGGVTLTPSPVLDSLIVVLSPAVLPFSVKRQFPVPHEARVFPLPNGFRTFPLRDGVFPQINFAEGERRILLGERGYPFNGLLVDPPSAITVVDWMKAGDPTWTRVNQGNWPDLLTASRFVSFTPQEFNAGLLFTIRTNVAFEQSLNVITDVNVAEQKVVGVNQDFKPFSDSTFSVDKTLVGAIKYEVAGATTVAKTAIPRPVVVTGTHDGSGNNASLVDSTKNFLTLGVRVGDIVKNTTDGSQALVTAFATTTNPNDTLTLDGLAGGAENDFDASDAYTIESGDSVILIAQNFDLSLPVSGQHTITLYITDGMSNEFSDSISVEVE